MRENNLKLTKEQYEDALKKLEEYIDKEMDIEVGNLEIQLLLDFIIEKIGVYPYNKAVSDMQKYVMDKADDMYAFML